MTNNCSALTNLHRCASDGLNPPSVVHKPEEIQHFNFVQEGLNAAWRTGAPVTAWVGRVKFLFEPSGYSHMLSYQLGDQEIEFGKSQRDNLVFRPGEIGAVGR